MQLLTRMILLIVGGQGVDVFNALEYAEHADSAFNAFSDFFVVMGLRVKETKAQKPQSHHVLQGVDFHVDASGVTLSPTTERVSKLQHAIRKAIEDDELKPQIAGRPAGKLSFLTQAVFGAVGRSARQPLYARSHDTSAERAEQLSVGLTENRTEGAPDHASTTLHSPRPERTLAGRDFRGRLRQVRGGGVQSRTHHTRRTPPTTRQKQQRLGVRSPARPMGTSSTATARRPDRSWTK